MTVLIFDIDGTFRDNQPSAMEAERAAAAEVGLTITEEQQTKERRSASEGDWKAHFAALGIESPKEHIQRFYRIVDGFLPPIVPGSKEVLEAVEDQIGLDRMFFITNSAEEDIKRWFHANGLSHFEPQLSALVITGEKSPCKSDEILFVSQQFANDTILFVGDSISDLASCWQAREKGAANLKFIGVTHKYSICDVSLQQYLEENPEVEAVVASLVPEFRGILRFIHQGRDTDDRS